MELFTNQVLAGIATGAIYACMALAVVMIYQAIDHLNFAQGEMAMFSTFMSWQMMQWGMPYWGAFVLTLVLSFVGGIAIERLLFKPLAKAPVLTNVAGFIALFAIVNSVAGLTSGDTVVIAGKGHEQGQEFEDGRKVPFDDRDVAREELRKLGSPA